MAILSLLKLLVVVAFQKLQWQILSFCYSQHLFIYYCINKANTVVGIVPTVS